MSMANLKIDPMEFEQMRASVLHGPRDLRIETRTIRPPNGNEVQIAIRSTGLCGSDLHYYQDFRNGDIICKEPLTLGHESSGIVISAGSSVKHLKVGDMVALEVGLPCTICEQCKDGRYNLCPFIKFRSSAKVFPHAQGTLQEKINHPAAYCHKLPADLSLEMGALLEPLSVAIHAHRRAKLRQSAKVLVFGAGAVGLLTAAVIRMQDPETVVVIADIDRGRIEFAIANGFAQHGYIVSPKRGSSQEEQLQISQQEAIAIGDTHIDHGQVGQLHAVFECTGVPSCVQTSIYATKPGGKVMLIGMGAPIQTLPLAAAALREVDILGVFRYADTYPTGIDILQRAQSLRAQGQSTPRFDRLVTHRYSGLDQVEDAFRTASKTVDKHERLVIKVVVDIGSAPTQVPKL